MIKEVSKQAIVLVSLHVHALFVTLYFLTYLQERHLIHVQHLLLE